MKPNHWSKGRRRWTIVAMAFAASLTVMLAACGSSAGSVPSSGGSSPVVMGLPGPCPGASTVTTVTADQGQVFAGIGKTTLGIGGVHIGDTVKAVKALWPTRHIWPWVTRNKTDQLFFCMRGQGPRVAFLTKGGLDAALSSQQQQVWADRLVFVDGSNRDLTILGVHIGQENTGAGYTNGLPNRIYKAARELGSPFGAWWLVPSGVPGIYAEFKLQQQLDGAWKAGEGGFISSGLASDPEARQQFFELLGV
jgi:hypothetical protein